MESDAVLNGVTATGDRLAAQIGRRRLFFLCVKTILTDELGDMPLYFRPRQIRRCTPHSHGKSRKIVAVFGAQKCRRVLVAGVFPHILENGPLALNISVPFLNGGVDVGLGRIALSRLLRRRHRKSGGLFALRFVNFLYLFLLRREET